MASVVKHPGLVRVRPNRSAWAMNAARQFNCSPGAGGSRPNLSTLSKEEKSSIEAACSTEKYTEGPAEYNACLQRELRELSGG